MLKRDTKIRPDAFTDAFTAEKFADVLFSQMLSAMLRQDYDPSTVLEIVRRTLYGALEGDCDLTDDEREYIFYTWFCHRLFSCLQHGNNDSLHECSCNRHEAYMSIQ